VHGCRNQGGDAPAETVGMRGVAAQWDVACSHAGPQGSRDVGDGGGDHTASNILSFHDGLHGVASFGAEMCPPQTDAAAAAARSSLAGFRAFSTVGRV
jgi:hypothetical protein